PYITASMMFRFLIPIIPALEHMQRQPGAQDKLQRYTYFLTIPMALLQWLGQVQIFNANIAASGGGLIIPGFGSTLLLTLSGLASMTAGTMFAVWLGELITEEGIGNGISIIIFAGIVASTPTNLANLIANSPQWVWDVLLFVVLTLASVVVIIYIQEG